jgi:predicted RNase H-like HicB family nuclease
MNLVDIRSLCPYCLGVLAKATLSKKEALANIKEAIELYIESLQEDGEPIPTEESVEEAVVEVAV